MYFGDPLCDQKENIYKSCSRLQLAVALVSVGDDGLGSIDSLGGNAGNLLGHFLGHRWLGGLDALDLQQLGLEDYDIN